MKKNMMIFFIAMILLVTAGCSGKTAVTQAAPPQGDVGEGQNMLSPTKASSNSIRLNTNYSNALPVIIQLAIGTINLESTDTAVTKEQAEQLLFLWKGIKYLQNNSGTAAPEETEAVIRQLQETMTSEQIKAIANMQLTQADIQETMRTYAAMAMDDVEESEEGFNAGMISAMSGRGAGAGGGRMPGGGGGPPGGAPGGGGMGGGDMEVIMGGGQQNLNEEKDAVVTISVDSKLLNVIIKTLQNKLLE